MREYEFFTAHTLTEAQNRTNELAEDGWQLKSVEMVKEPFDLDAGFRKYWLVVMEHKK